jgi:hypothetical protein
MIKTLYAGALVLALAVPALAAQEYYVALNTSTKQCLVMATEPDGITMRQVGDQSYSSIDEAEQAIEHLRECTS